MQWVGWFVIALVVIPFIYGFTVLLREPGSILRPIRKPDKDYVYQQPMIRRWTDKRKSEARLEKAEWDVEFTKLDALLTANYILETRSFVPTSVLEFAQKADPELYNKLQKHNDNLQWDLEIARYSNQYKQYSDRYGDFNV